MSVKFRKTVRTLHLWLALLSGLVIFVVAVTGCIYCFETELRGVLHSDLYKVPVTAVARQPISVITDAVKSEFPKQKIKFVNLSAEPGTAAIVALKNKTNVFVNPYNGSVVGSLDMEKGFFAVVLQLHRNLLLGDPGKLVIGISALVFFVMIVSGIVLWWPRNRDSVRWKFRIKKATGPARTNYDLHSVLGFYASWFLLISVLTGLIFSFKWAERSMYWLAGSVKNEKKPSSVYQPGPSLAPDLIASAMTTRYQGADVSIFFPEDSVGVYRASAEVNPSGFGAKKDFYFFDRYSGKLVDLRLARYASRGENLRAANYDIHTGKVFGLMGQILMFCASLTAASLPVTGLLIWWNRSKKKKLPSIKKLRRVSEFESQKV